MNGTLMQANRQWSTRPSDERFTSLIALRNHFEELKHNSRQAVVSTRSITATPDSNDESKGLVIVGNSGVPYTPTNWSFGQLATLAKAPAGYLRTLPAPMAADCLNYGLKVTRDNEDVGILLTRSNDVGTLRAATGPKYGRVWNRDIANQLVSRFGDGLSGDFRIPGEFGKAIEVTKANTTLYGSDRDMFVFLADEQNRIEIPNRRNGESGLLARGFFVWNSEVGAQTLGIGTFLFDYVCCNRIVWGATQYKELRIRHTVSAPERFIDEVTPAIEAYANGSAQSVVRAIEDARQKRIDNPLEFLQKRFSAKLSKQLAEIHVIEEERPIENLWDVSTAITAFARTINHQDSRVEMERQAGEILDLAA